MGVHQYAPTVSDQDVERVIRREYPAELHAFRIDRLSDEEQARIIERDKSQYLKWLNGDGTA